VSCNQCSSFSSYADCKKFLLIVLGHRFNDCGVNHIIDKDRFERITREASFDLGRQASNIKVASSNSRMDSINGGHKDCSFCAVSMIG